MAIIDYTDGLGGPALWVLEGSDDPSSEFRLGTREYDWHGHVHGQFFCIESGLIHVRTAQGSWLLPPHRAGWMPPGVEHKISVSGVMRGWGVMIEPSSCAALPDAPCVVGLNELVAALVRRAAGWSRKSVLDAAQERLVAVLLDEIVAAPREPLHLPMPDDARLLRLANRLAQHPDQGATLDELARAVGLSARTARRLFLAETGMNFVHWRQQAQLTYALERLAGGDAVGDIADALGYATASNFIAMFRRALGASPGSYFARRSPPR
ncbi:AraC family transcriptional regulator [Burkholderia alba]|uniref:AraC family transcriptional regulator n=1 Tax=Burkholderia alba TaxID=2683677 RepID=UPI002B052759|nr:helix-turn-helix transcriptional regulator [Burkholderia alba]